MALEQADEQLSCQVRLNLEPLEPGGYRRAIYLGLLKAWLLICNEVLHLQGGFVNLFHASLISSSIGLRFGGL